ncbi:hypothetical protein [Pseudobacillus badius]|uniref:hypothetical protein n=1 Tax=Bacillus badius TaxID=1455 RepID=UPI0007B3D0F6|nr:hypothetical protein [Bacillus badius]KZR59791.1 hypothetical protein A3781_12105 [Bacillus badius]
MKCPKCEEEIYRFLLEELERPFDMIVLKCEYCDTVISAMESVDTGKELVEIRNQLDRIDEQNQLIIEILERVYNI